MMQWGWICSGISEGSVLGGPVLSLTLGQARFTRSRQNYLDNVQAATSVDPILWHVRHCCTVLIRTRL